MASTCLAEFLISARASPSLRCQKSPVSSRPARNIFSISGEEVLLPLPSSQTIGRDSRAVLARHQVSATTATVKSLTFTTPFTPRKFLTFASSKLTNLPPKTGQAFTAAHNMPGNWRSAPKTFLPLTFSAVSKRARG